ncbi:MAG: hypothetical protein IJZ00_00460 [Lachnospiraceae bacterium]|nr:hypothetical protein [Lachnospiraceae bacterium]
MYRPISEKEQLWIDYLLNVDFPGRNILAKQFLKAKVIYKQEYSYISIKFKVEGEVEPYPFRVRVPIEMRAFQRTTSPIVFLLHVMDGIIDELEIYTADLTHIDANNIQLEHVEYVVNREEVRGDQSDVT